MRVVICWAKIAGYTAACWRALAARPGIDLRVLAFVDDNIEQAFAPEVLHGVSCQLLSPQERNDPDRVRSLVLEQQPDALILCGWFHPPYVKLAFHPALSKARKLMVMDTPWRGGLRQQLAKLRLRRYLERMDYIFVAGERSWQYARRLGVAEARIRRGMNACDFPIFAAAIERRRAAPQWPRKFLYTGRYVREKGLDTLLEGYARYRRRVSDPWPLTCCGKGPLRSMLISAAGVEDRGFVQPSDLPDVMAEHGAFVLTSRSEPWGVVIAEASAAGLPIICTEAVGASVELVRSYFNGLTVATDDPPSLAAALQWMHEHPERLPGLGRQGHHLAAAFSAEMWAQRWFEALTSGSVNPSQSSQ